MGLSPSSRTHTIVDPPIPVELQKDTHVAAPMLAAALVLLLLREGTPPQNVALMLHYLLSHVQSGLMDNSTKSGLLGVWMVLFTIFAARKFQQPIKVKYLPMICIRIILSYCFASSIKSDSFILFLIVKDDISDKSIFMFNALPEEEKNALIQKLERQTQQKFE